jgi:hypothetical protein
VPFVPRAANRPIGDAAFPGWPDSFEGRKLTQLQLSDREAGFAEGFPGRIGRFTDGSREVVVRWVSEETRMLHPAADCYAGLGYSIRPLPPATDDSGALWGRFEAAKGPERILVRERITDDAGGAWTDVSAWYWAALLERSAGPWWSVTTADRLPA